MGRYTCFEDGKWRIKVGDAEFAGPWVDKLSYYEELAPNLENTKDEAYNLGYQTCLHAKGLAWSEAKELQVYRATGLSVERAAELGKADQEGRVVIKQYWPVKKGDTVYTIRDNNVLSHCVIGKSEGNGWMVILAYRDGKRLAFGLLDIGKTVFLAREEAEKALEAENRERL